ncbi:MAG TPA: hypothetical protein VLW05_05080 [Gaiellaceae bacterium]|nr:hypothetical protein [Gaiellaceae bacterium]
MRDLDSLVAGLDLDVGHIGICHACLSFVSFPLDAGDVRTARSEARTMTPVLWDEGLAGPALAAVRDAAAGGVAGAEAALADLEEKGGRSAVARAIVLRLAADLVEQMRAELRLLEVSRRRLELAPPEWN